ncbi:cyclic nucleotide-binding domain-containing protein [Caenispirillum bisanense]|uniref:CAAX protease self-immunity n=1 Tax=Caenispirillum bisanense TaxID=414052 RepID=A0A286GWM1_9PROT|nr:cyclic nucleotide-binding domain-containing protein [Caenispirillum bisanense]SOD99928.1 CAAX protease self-immunity [Caenispirillum bisanense]
MTSPLASVPPAPSSEAPAASPRDALDKILPGLSPAMADAVRQAMVVRHVAAGATIMTEGDRTDSLYLIEDGNVTVFRALGIDGGERILATLPAGAILGEMALLDGQPRSASVRAATDCRLTEIAPAKVLALPNGEQVLAAIRSSLAVAVTNRMRTQTDKYVAAVEREMAAIKERQHFGRFFIYALGLMTIGLLVNDILSKQILDVDIFTPTFAWVYLLIIMIPTSLVIWRMKIPLRDLGITTIGMKRSIVEGAILSAATVAVAFAAAWVLRTTGIHAGTPVPAEWGPTTGYFFHSVLQELVARGLLQSSFQRFLDDRRGLQSVVLSSTLFGVFHIHFGFMAVVVTILSGLLFGAVYLRHRNLAGVTLLHFFAGGAAFWSGLL